MKQVINNLKDYAELAQASYFYFDLLKDSNNIPRNIYELDSMGNKIEDKSYPRGYKEVEITIEHIVSKEYQGQEVLVNLRQDNTWQSNLLNAIDDKTNSDKLNGEFGEIQVNIIVFKGANMKSNTFLILLIIYGVFSLFFTFGFYGLIGDLQKATHFYITLMLIPLFPYSIIFLLKDIARNFAVWKLISIILLIMSAYIYFIDKYDFALLRYL
ncbi:hypothetical protein [Helicobacter saguini]|uniref:hypothetical protein n=1 Tax=Helicobacter saguini TaxID=1548018 RepID=UPI000AAF4630|nr:hypothetical protein [Helicobacter saguini]